MEESLDMIVSKLSLMKDTINEASQRGCSNIEIEVDHTDLTLKGKKVRVWYSSGIIEELPIGN